MAQKGIRIKWFFQRIKNRIEKRTDQNRWRWAAASHQIKRNEDPKERFKPSQSWIVSLRAITRNTFHVGVVGRPNLVWDLLVRLTLTILFCTTVVYCTPVLFSDVSIFVQTCTYSVMFAQTKASPTNVSLIPSVILWPMFHFHWMQPFLPVPSWFFVLGTP
jgi:hypothetical protein